MKQDKQCTKHQCKQPESLECCQTWACFSLTKMLLWICSLFYTKDISSIKTRIWILLYSGLLFDWYFIYIDPDIANDAASHPNIAFIRNLPLPPLTLLSSYHGLDATVSHWFRQELNRFRNWNMAGEMTGKLIKTNKYSILNSKEFEFTQAIYPFLYQPCN